MIDCYITALTKIQESDCAADCRKANNVSQGGGGKKREFGDNWGNKLPVVPPVIAAVLPARRCTPLRLMA